jgi:hypothetical protein
MAKSLFSVDTAPAIALTTLTNLHNWTLFQVFCSFGTRSPLGRSLGQFVVVLLMGRPFFFLSCYFWSISENVGVNFQTLPSDALAPVG